MNRNLTKKAWIPIVALGLMAAPALGWAQTSAPAGASHPQAQDAGDAGNNTTAKPIQISPHASAKSALPGQSVVHSFRVTSLDGKAHAVEIRSKAFGSNWTYSVNNTAFQVDANVSATVTVTVRAPLLPGSLGHLVILQAYVQNLLADQATATTTYILP